MKVVRSSASRTGRLYSHECSWYTFSLGAESTPGPWYGRKEYVTEKSSGTTGNRSRDRPTSSAANFHTYDAKNIKAAINIIIIIIIIIIISC